MREVALEDGGGAVDVGRQEDGRSAHAWWFRPLHRGDEAIQRKRGLRQESIGELPSTIPGGHQQEHPAAERKRHPATSRDLEHVRDEERKIDREECAGQRTGTKSRPVPAVAGDRVEQHARNGHRSGDGDAVRGTEGARRLEAEDKEQGADHQGHIHGRDVDLPHLGPRGVNDRDARAVVELHALLGQRETPPEMRACDATTVTRVAITTSA